MPRAPWLSGAVSNKLATDARQERLQVRGLEGLHVNQERARVEQAEGERALRSSRPPNSRRWRQLAKHDDAADKATQRHAQAQHALQRAEQRLQAAPGCWSLASFASGEPGRERAGVLALGVSRDFFDDHVKPELRVVRRGRLVLVPVRELERWVEENSAAVLS